MTEKLEIQPHHHAQGHKVPNILEKIMSTNKLSKHESKSNGDCGEYLLKILKEDMIWGIPILFYLRHILRKYEVRIRFF